MSFVFYDTETTGTNTSFDQILQFAAIHTDENLNELERFEIRCQLLPFIVPAPAAMRITGVSTSQLFDPTLPTHYQMVRQIQEKLATWGPAIFIGYNSIQFDEHLIRQSLYKTLHMPYVTNTNGNTRSDALRIVQAASIFAPNTLAIPIGENGKNIFKLDRVAPANGFNHANAHDALADVEATIFLCRKIMQRASNLWDHFMDLSNKTAVCDYVFSESVFCLSDFYFGRDFSWLVTLIGSNPEISSELFVFDLSIDPHELIDLTDTDLARRLDQKTKPIRCIKANACPIIMSASDTPLSTKVLQLGQDELIRRAKFLGENEKFRSRLIAAQLSLKTEFERSPYVEQQIYDNFFSKSDEYLLNQFHLHEWEERVSIVEAFKDSRLRTIGQRLVYTERPDLLSDSERSVWDKAIAKRLIGSKGDEPWLTLPKALEEIEEMIAKADNDNIGFLKDHRDYLSNRLTLAQKMCC